MTVPYRPTWLSPAQPGYITNKRGSNVGSDNIPVTFRFRSPKGSALVAGIKSTWTRIASAGGSGVAATLWDQPPLGNPASSPYPNGAFAAGLGGGNGVAGAVSAVYNGRLYMIGGRQGQVEQQATADVWSAPIGGPGCVGSWRRETPLPSSQVTGTVLPLGGLAYAVGGVTSDGYLVVAGGHDQLPTVAAGYVFTCPILSDGTLGPWTQQTALPAGRVYAAGFIRNNVITVAGGSTSTSVPAAQTTVYYATITAGVISSWTTSANVLTVGVYGGTAIHRPDTGVYLIAGGVNAAAAVVLTVQQTPVTAGVPGVWAASANSLPAARCFATGGWVPAFANQTNGAAIVAGGDSNVGPNGTKTATIYTNPNPNGGAWTTNTPTGFVATDSGAIYGLKLIENESVLLVISGYTSTQVDNRVFYCRIASNSAFFPAGFGSGAGSAMTTAQVNDLPYGGSVVTNADGTQDITLVYGGYDQTTPQTLNDGDLIQVTVTAWETSGGDSSVAFSTLLKIAQPPTITGAAVAAGGEPLCSWGYSDGAGGSGQASWQVIVGALFDSGLRLDQVNSVALSQAPKWPNAIQQTATITVKSKDTAIAGSTNQASTTVNFTPAYTGPAIPTGVTVTPNHAQGSVTLSWTNPSASTAAFNRIYYRRTGTALWKVLQDNIPALIGVAQSVTVFDELALGVQYDFAIGATTATAEGGASSPIVTNPDLELAPTNGANIQSLFKSLGADSSATLVAWTTDAGVPTISLNLVTLPTAGASIRAGHPDWTDCTTTIRFRWDTGGDPQLLVHASDANNHISCDYDGANLRLNKRIASVASVVGGPAAFAGVNGTFYWMRIVASGTSYTATLYSDVAGAIGAQQATCSAVITDAILQSGFMGLRAGSATASVFGGAFNTVCQVTGPMPIGVTTNINVSEPAFCWSKVNPFSGAFSLSIRTNATGSGYFSYPTGTAGIPALASTTYQIAAYVRTSGASLKGAVGIFEYTAAGAFVQQEQAAYVTATVWTLASFNPATAGTTAFITPFLGTDSNTGTVYFDFLSANLPAMSGIKLDPVQGGLSGLLHLAGSGASFRVALLMEERPNIATKLDAVQILPFAQQAGSVRNGVLYYRLVKVKVFFPDATGLRSLQALMAQAMTGVGVYYRDAFGAMLLCAFEPDQAVEYAAPSYRYINLSFFEIANQYAPSLSQGSATGFRAWSNGAVVPLDTSEGGL